MWNMGLAGGRGIEAGLCCFCQSLGSGPGKRGRSGRSLTAVALHPLLSRLERKGRKQVPEEQVSQPGGSRCGDRHSLCNLHPSNLLSVCSGLKRGVCPATLTVCCLHMGCIPCRHHTVHLLLPTPGFPFILPSSPPCHPHCLKPSGAETPSLVQTLQLRQVH